MKKIIEVIIILLAILYIIPNTREQIDNTFFDKIIETEVQAETVEEITEVEEIKQEPITKASEQGKNFIKSKEGLRLTSYLLKNENAYTIGYGHKSKNIKANETITKEKANEYFNKDIEKFENAVASKCGYLNLTQNEFDALVSFAYNLGEGNLDKLTNNQTRTKEEVAEHITAYNGSKSKDNKNGLTTRRQEELQMFKGE